MGTSAPGTCEVAVCFECASCHYQGSLTAGTILSCARTDLRKWLLAIWLLASTKTVSYTHLTLPTNREV